MKEIIKETMKEVVEEKGQTIRCTQSHVKCGDAHASLPFPSSSFAFQLGCYEPNSSHACPMPPIVADGEHITSAVSLPWSPETLLKCSFLEPPASYTHSAQEQLEAMMQAIIENEDVMLPLLGLLCKKAISDSRLHDIVRTLQGKLQVAVSMAATLSPREMEILELAAQGQSNAQIAEYLSVQIVTVGKALSRAYRKLEAKNRAEAVHKWIFLRTTLMS